VLHCGCGDARLQLANKITKVRSLVSAPFAVPERFLANWRNRGSSLEDCGHCNCRYQLLKPPLTCQHDRYSYGDSTYASSRISSTFRANKTRLLREIISDFRISKLTATASEMFFLNILISYSSKPQFLLSHLRSFVRQRNLFDSLTFASTESSTFVLFYDFDRVRPKD
jgi:hypothetical protein